MTYRSRFVQIGCVFSGLLAMSAMAAPPIFSDHNRTYGNEVGADICFDVSGGQRCANLNAWEHYDVKGTYQYTGIWVWYSFGRPNLDGWRQSTRWMSCQLSLKAIGAQPNHVTLEAVLHPNGPECDSGGQIEVCDESGNNCVFLQPWGFSDPTVVTGEWIDSLNTSKVVENRIDNFYDPWSETSHRTVTHCNENWGDLMTQGGFSIESGPRIRHFPFQGIDTPGWSFYSLRSCNNNLKAK